MKSYGKGRVLLLLPCLGLLASCKEANKGNSSKPPPPSTQPDHKSGDSTEFDKLRIELEKREVTPTKKANLLIRARKESFPQLDSLIKRAFPPSGDEFSKLISASINLETEDGNSLALWLTSLVDDPVKRLDLIREDFDGTSQQQLALAQLTSDVLRAGDDAASWKLISSYPPGPVQSKSFQKYISHTVNSKASFQNALDNIEELSWQQDRNPALGALGTALKKLIDDGAFEREEAIDAINNDGRLTPHERNIVLSTLGGPNGNQ